MHTAARKGNVSSPRANTSGRLKPESPPLRLETREQAREYLRTHLTPIEYGPKGQPIYALADLQALNVIFPDDL
jgi:hypothetical protein